MAPGTKRQSAPHPVGQLGTAGLLKQAALALTHTVRAWLFPALARPSYVDTGIIFVKFGSQCHSSFENFEGLENQRQLV